MAHDIFIKANIYENTVREKIISDPKNSHLNQKQINKKIRDRVNKKFQAETQKFLNLYMTKVLSHFHQTTHKSFQ